LGEYWSRNGIAFDEVLSGAMTRHRRTAELALGGEPRVSADWNEYDAGGILRGRAASLKDNRAFQRVFEGAMLEWLAGSPNGAEPWTEFRDRVLRGLREVLKGGSSRKVVVFTSGGPIGVLVQTALDAPERSFLEVNWRVRNCSITEFVFSGERLTLDSFNGVPHLTDAGLRTFR
jgi:broad specificity phosphatase PhoE